MWRDLWYYVVQDFAPSAAFVAVFVGILYCVARMTGQMNRKGHASLLVAFGVLGGVVGVLIGSSLTPVVGTVLPALLTFASAVLAYLFGKDSLSEWRPVIPYCILALLLNAYYGSFVGGGIRREYQEYQRRYDEWKLHYEKVELEIAKQQYVRLLQAGKLDGQLLDPQVKLPQAPGER